MARITLLFFFLFLANVLCKQDSSGSNREIPFAHIGFQYWMTKNLDTPIEGSVCYGNDPKNCSKYGRLYTWQSAMNACPDGWKLPSDIEWFDLTDALGGTMYSGGALKEGGDAGFEALLGGKRNGRGEYVDIGKNGYYWTSTEVDALNAWNRILYKDSVNISGEPSNKSEAYCIRCIKIKRLGN